MWSRPLPEPPDASRFTVWLNSSMENRRLTQADLARAVGVGDAQVSRWRRGQVVPTVRSLQRIADTFGVPRAMLDSLAGYPSDASEAAGDAPDNLARRAEIRAYQAWFGEQLDEQVPHELWQVYADGCAALARALGESYRATMARAETVALTAPAERHETPAEEPRPRREIGFRS
jgi:transcriptional regulator with XRE-family HTH domain